MNVSLLNSVFTPGDAIGQNLLHQARYFLRRGDTVRLYVQHHAPDVPAELQTLLRPTTLEQLQAGSDAHFTHSDLYVYHFPAYYPLLDTLRELEHGAALFCYHNVTPPELWGNPFEREVLQHSRAVVGDIARYADLIVADSPFNKEDLVAAGSDPTRIRVLPLAVPLDAFSPGPPNPALVERYGVSGRPVLLFVGRVAGNKRVDLLVEAMPRVLEAVPDALLLVVGDDRTNPALAETAAAVRARAAALGVADAVRLTGPVPEIAPFFRLAAVYASASLHEGFGVPLIEAMAAGVPVVASDIAAHPWVLGDAGLLVPPRDVPALADALTRVLRDPALAQQLRLAGLERARSFSVEQYWSGWDEVVTEATRWLPHQPAPRALARASAAPVTPAPEEPSPLQQTLERVHFHHLVEKATEAHDVMDRGYEVRSGLPLVGRAIAWLRRNLTSHLREPYLDPALERQVHFNRVMVWSLNQINELIGQPAVHAMEEWDARLRRVEAQVGLLTAQVGLLQARQGGVDESELAALRGQIETLQHLLAAGDDRSGTQ